MGLHVGYIYRVSRKKVSMKNFLTLNYSLLYSTVFSLLWIQWICKFCFMFEISFIRFGSLKVKLQSFFGDAIVLKVCKLNTHYAIKFYKCSGKKPLPNVKMFF